MGINLLVVTRSKDLLVRALVLLTLVGSGSVFASDMTTDTKPSIATDRVTRINPVAFCDSVKNVFHQYSRSLGNPDRSSIEQASVASKKMISNLRKGEKREHIYLNNYLELSQGEQESSAQRKQRYFSLASILQNSLKIKEKIVLGYQVHELRFLPHVQMGSHIVLLLQGANGLSVRRARMVYAAAKRMKVKLSFVWLGKNSFDNQQSTSARAIEFLSAATNGKLLDLGGNKNVCTTYL